ncbi:MAG TPA: hypothetical protein VNG12_13210 [Acidimicrobiales bacterium]|nr:hypothetical protein [Acidimicrobiales bacterium]
MAYRVADAWPRGRVVVRGTIRATKAVVLARSVSCSCVFEDGTGEIDLLFVGRRTVAGLEPGAPCTVEGTAKMEGKQLVLWNPLYRLESHDAGTRDRARRVR